MLHLGAFGVLGGKLISRSLACFQITATTEMYLCMYVFYLAESIFRLQIVVKSIKTVISGFYGGKH